MYEVLAVLALSCGKPIVIPDETRWIAQDADGYWWWYAKEPEIRGSVWRLKTPENVDHAVLAIGTRPKDFRTMIWKV